jgi:hypothetical protein
MHILRTVRPMISGMVALASCPCHLPLTFPLILSLTARTGLGIWLANNTPAVVGGSVLVFVSSLLLTLRWSKTSPQVRFIEPNKKPAANTQEISRQRLDAC